MMYIADIAPPTSPSRDRRGDRDPEHALGEFGVDPRELRRHGLTQQAQRLGRGRWRLGDALGPVEGEARIVQHFLEAVAGMDALEAEARALLVKAEMAERRHQRNRPPAAEDVGWAGAGRTDEVDLLDQRPARMLEPEEHDARHHEIEIGRAIGAGKARLGMGVIADRVEIDVAAAIDLRAGKEEDIDASLTGAVEELAPAIGPEIVLG